MFFYISWISWTIIQLITPTASVKHSGQRFEMKTENLNKRLLGYKLFERKVFGLHECASECMFLGACESVNYITSNKTCEFNSEGSETVDTSNFTESMMTIFSDITEWPQSMILGCAFHTCGLEQRCSPLGYDAYECVNIVCGDKPGDTQNAIVQPGLNIAGSVRTYVFTCPQGMVVKGDQSVTCLLNGEWSSLTAYCKVKTLGGNCTSSADCKETGSECILENCFCGRLYRYNDDLKDCVKVCSKMTDSFTAHASTRIGGRYNDRESSYGYDGDERDCREMCNEDADCLSFEYGPNSNDEIFCRGSSVSKGMIEDTFPEKISSANFDLYSRDCT